MCGIVGCFNFNKKYSITDSYIINMRDTMINRGPDSSGIWISKDNNVGFGFRRLAIIDLTDAANQPMTNNDESICIVFNGEIYNHLDIREELNKHDNFIWKTDHSDTEVIIHAYEKWGIDFVHKLRGMFSIAIWDSRKNELFLIRDRIGVKPLYYSCHNDRLVFASEIKALLADPDQKRELNIDGIFDYLSFLTIPAPNTLFSDIFKLEPGTWLKIDINGNKEIFKYWDVLDNVMELSKLTEVEISNLILGKLRESIKLRMISDVPCGVFLSGGVDSSTNAILFSELDNLNSVNTFSIGYDGEYESYTNELKYAKNVAELINATYYEKKLNINDLINFLPEMIKFQDEPIADPVCVPLYYVSKLARENNVIVCQVGEGADELFWGYPNWKSLYKLQKLSNLPIPFFIRKIVVKILEFLKLDNGWKFEYIKRSSMRLPIFWGGAETFTTNEKMLLLSPKMREKFKNKSSWDSIEKFYSKFKKKSKTNNILDWMTYLDLNFRLPELLLMRVDKMTMANSIEARVPFLDHKFVEMALSIPEKIKIKNGTLKYILKKAVNGIVPNYIINRKKQGFAAPIEEWLNGELGDIARKDIMEFCIQTDLLDYSEVEKILNGNQKSRIWTILNLALWWKEYIK